MGRPVLFKGIDVAVPLTYTQCEDLKAANYKFVCRYYTDYLNPIHKWKMMYANEAKLISKVGLDIVSVYQTYGHNYKNYTIESGKQDCINAIKCAEMIGQPSNTTIYFAIGSQDNNICEYFLGISEEMKNFMHFHNNKSWNIGVYGNYYIIKSIYNKYGVLDCWQTVIGSDNKIYDKAHLLQYKLRFPSCNIKEIDEDAAYSHYFGQFRI